MTAQLDMLDPPIYRRTDPAPSKAAADALERRGRRKRDQATLLGLIEERPGLTALEYADHLIRYRGYSWFRAYQLCNKRMSDLHGRGLIRSLGERCCSITGRTARTWAV